MSPTTTTVHVNGVDLAVDQAGGDGRPLLAIHGFICSRTDFDRTAEDLAVDGWAVTSPDLRGHGDSTHLDIESAYSFEHYVDDLLALVDELGFARFAVLGHSMGGMIAQLLALRIPDRVTALVLADTTHGPVFPAEATEQLAAVARADGVEAVADALAGMGKSEAYRRAAEADPDYAARADRTLRASSMAMFAAMFPAISAQPDRLDALPALTVPTLVVVGEEDELFLADADRMARAMPHAELAVIPGAGHAPHFEAYDEWLAVLRRFLADLPTAPTIGRRGGS